MFVSPFAVALGCDATITVIYLQHAGNYGGTPWLTIQQGNGFAEEMVDIVWLALLRVVFLLPHVLPFLRRRRLARPFLPKSFITLNFLLITAKAIALLVKPPAVGSLIAWWILVFLSVVSAIAHRACLHHLRSSYAHARYKTIFIGSRLDARLLEREPDSESDAEGDRDLEAGVGFGEENIDSRRSAQGSRRLKSARRVGLARGLSRPRQESTRELVDYFAARMQEARDAWSSRVEALQRRWRASILSVDWLRRGDNPLSERDEALRLTFGLIVRMYAYEDALEDLRQAAVQEPWCLEFFAPQLASFLLFDSYYMSGQMEEWLLARCSENLYFAHALEFQLRAICLPPTGTGLGASSEGVGAPPSPEEAKSDADDSGESRRRGDRDRRGSSGFGSAGSGIGSRRQESDDERIMIDRVGRRAVGLLLGEIARKGEYAARRLLAAQKAASLEGGSVGRRSGGDGQDGGGAADHDPPPPGAVYTAGVDWEEKTDEEDQRGGGAVVGPAVDINPYHETTNFVSSLTGIAASLTPLSRAERTPTLRKQLEEVGKRCLRGKDGSEGRLVYVPLSNRRHRVVAVHPAESFAFSTRERAPCFVCLEVISSVDDEQPQRQQRQQRQQQQEKEEQEDNLDRGRRGVSFEAGVEPEASMRLGALWQWLPARLRSPSSAAFRRTFRFSGGREWTLSVRGLQAGDGRGDPESRRSRSSSITEGFRGRARVTRGRGLSQGGRSRQARSEPSGAGVEDRYRLMSEGSVQSGGEGGRAPPSDATEWWAEGGDEAWGGGEDEAGVDTVKTSVELGGISDLVPPPGGAPHRAEGVNRGGGDADDSRDERSGAGTPSAAIADEGSKLSWRCSVCDAKSGERCRPGCPSEKSRKPEDEGIALGAAGGRRGEAEEKRPQPQVLFSELWKDKSDRVRRVSPWAGERGWRLLPIIVKANDDLRQEQLASQLLHTMRRVLRAEGVRVWLRPYDIIPLTADSGIIEAVEDTISLDALGRYRRKRKAGPGSEDDEDSGGAKRTGESGMLRFSLKGFFESRFGPKGSDGFRQAQRRFIESLAAYSIACYLLQIKDRHNGNILLDAQGRLIHVDFGFMLANSPGGNLGFESAPFKLTPGFIELMGGTRSRCFRDFCGLCVDVYLALRRNSQEIILLVEMMASGNEALPCFQGPGGGAAAAADLAARFQPDLNDPACVEFVHKLVQQSVGNWRTDWYDKYQRFWSGIY